MSQCPARPAEMESNNIQVFFWGGGCAPRHGTWTIMSKSQICQPSNSSSSHLCSDLIFVSTSPHRKKTVVKKHNLHRISRLFLLETKASWRSMDWRRSTSTPRLLPHTATSSFWIRQVKICTGVYILDIKKPYSLLHFRS
jgi:hypothetical protein